jgi:AraC-like DNA-binding protein
MFVDPSPLVEIIESYAVTTGLPAFLMDGSGNIQLASRGFSPQEFSFADPDSLRVFLEDPIRFAALHDDQYYTVFTENRFLYNFAVVEAQAGRQILFSGPARLHPLTDAELTSLLKSKQISMRKKAEIGQVVAKLPLVSLTRLDHLGRVLWSLCHAYCAKGRNVMPDSELPVEIEAENEAVISKRPNFSLVEEETYSPFELIQLIKNLMLAGDVSGLRRLKEQNKDVPLDKLFETDATLSVKYRAITCYGAWAGMIFDQHIPFDHVMMVLNQYTRWTKDTDSIPEMTNYVFDIMQEFAWLVRKYSAQQYTKPVRQVLHYIQANLTKKISLEDLANLTGLSRPYLSRLINKETSCSLGRLIDTYRLEESKNFLLNTDYSILRIAELAGFVNQNYFALRFKKLTGLTPTAYRQKGGGSGSGKD